MESLVPTAVSMIPPQGLLKNHRPLRPEVGSQIGQHLNRLLIVAVDGAKNAVDSLDLGGRHVLKLLQSAHGTAILPVGQTPRNGLSRRGERLA
jgi:hypothetical protein